MSFDGKPFPKRSFCYYLKKYTDRAIVHYIQPKGLRHSHASLLINEWNVTPTAIQKRLGHSNVETTLNIYSHLYPNYDKDITDKLNKLI
ncbi:tyrosine-type recombinase/integrase [Streptococcus parauberis]|uniref:tyrosine-type recombinase/integrase n=1 Tax=Streptococcus parauberis TaxID=1348 RepID=UPI002150B21C|nr:tyrosine-type recombinase/integrase [Streptococcus parauberis]UWM88007.1 tyrosine-type recombinase/integrase [Streptococcus parauberis]UWM89978.1 tyrosine-type recombinase/integrase [Streptococcus parauberis]WEM60630.1 tyrosine-type recombinase/integrase [Streptococcus parauberis]